MNEFNTNREVIRCGSCGLMQYMTANQRCRQCHIGLRRVESSEVVPKPVRGGPRHSFSVAIPLKRQRRLAGLSQRQLGARLDVARTYISKIERGLCIPYPSTVIRLAEALGVPAADLIEDERGQHAKMAADLLADPFLAQIAEAVPYLSHTQRGLVLIEARKMVDYNMRAARREAI